MQYIAQALNLHFSYKNHNKRSELVFIYLCMLCVQIKSNSLRRRNWCWWEKGGNKGRNPTLGAYSFPLGAPVGTRRLWWLCPLGWPSLCPSGENPWELRAHEKAQPWWCYAFCTVSGVHISSFHLWLKHLNLSFSHSVKLASTSQLTASALQKCSLLLQE